MRALHFDGSAVRVADLPEPEPLPGEALVRVRLAGICKTDLEIARGFPLSHSPTEDARPSMRYPDGQLARVGDKVRLWNGAEGVVVCSLDTGEYSDEYTEGEWGYLRKGVLIESAEAGLIHHLEPEATFRLIERRK